MAKLSPLLVVVLAASILLPGCAGVGPARVAKAHARPDFSGHKAFSQLDLFAAEDALVAIAPNIYVDRDISSANAAHLLNLVDKARIRAGYYYGELVSKPEILFCSSMESYRKFGGVGLGYTLGNTILISPYGWRAAILSHELSHVELAARLGGLPEVLDKVPQWFDEGAAVMVSMAHEFSDEAWREASHNGEDSPRLSELESVASWNSVTGANGVNMQRSYGTARQEVIRWYAVVGRRGMEQLIQALKANQDFHLAYRGIEDSSVMHLAVRE